MKRKIADFTFAFTLALVILSALALISRQSFFDGVFTPSPDGRYFTLFDMRFSVNSRFAEAAESLFYFNERFFGKPAVGALKGAADWVFTFVGQLFDIIFSLLRDIMGLV